jgi:hypothetical protein
VGCPRNRPKRLYVCNRSPGVAAFIVHSAKQALRSMLVGRSSSYWHCHDSRQTASLLRNLSRVTLWRIRPQASLKTQRRLLRGRPVWDVLRRLEYQLSHQRCAALQMPNTRPSGELLGVLKGAWSFRKIPSGGKRRIDAHLERRAVSPLWLGLVTTPCALTL